MTSKVKVAVEGAVATITLNDPATLNACDPEMAAGLHEVVAGFADPTAGVRAVILTGEGRAFCSGANLSSRGDGGGVVDKSALEKIYNPMITSLRTISVPLITAVNGPAAGIGCSIALLGDLILAADNAYFLLAFRRIGLVPDGGSTWMLPRMIGRARTMEMALLGEKLPAAKALEWGLINQVVAAEALLDTARTFAGQLATGPASLGLTRQLINQAEEASWAEQLDSEQLAQRRSFETLDAREGALAFLEKRGAVFVGK